MEFFRHQTKYDFMGIRKWTAILSLMMTLGSLGALYFKGLNFGLDFTGGTQLELRFSRPTDFEEVGTELKNVGFYGAKVTQYGSSYDILIRIPRQANDNDQRIVQDMVDSLKTLDPNLELRRAEFVGGEVGDNLAEQGGLAVLAALLATLIYIAFRFEYRFGVSATVALLHDPILILGIFSFFQIDFDLATLAGILAVIGYSLNDTIVVFDRVRENFRKCRKGTSRDIMNMSINQTLSRTIMTSATTLLVVIALYLFGGESLHGFSLSLLIGILIGTYSSIFVAGALALQLGVSRLDLTPAQKKMVDDLP